MPGSSLRPSRGECPVAPRWASRQLPPDGMTAAAPCHLPCPGSGSAPPIGRGAVGPRTVTSHFCPRC